MAQLPVLLALADAQAESLLTAALGRGSEGLAVVRSCSDLEDLLVTAATGVAAAVLVSPDLPRLDREALVRLHALGVAPVGLAADEDDERRLRRLGLVDVQPGGAPVAAVAAAVHHAVARRAEERVPVAFAHGLAVAVPEEEAGPDEGGGTGQVVAVWGPTGAPGRSTVALGLAHALARRGWPTLLVDADVYGGTLAGGLGLADESPGLAAACRLANAGSLDAPALSSVVQPGAPALSVLTGLDRADRWPEVRPGALERVLEVARCRAAVTVVDCGFALEQDEEITYDTLAPRRNGATLLALEVADLVVVVGSAEPAGLRRLAHGLDELREAVPDARTTVVLNRVRPSLRGGAAWVRRHAGADRVTEVPLDVPALDEAAARGRWVAPESAVGRAFEQLAGTLVGR